MTDEEMRVALAEVLEEVASIEPADVQPDRSLVEDLDIDSLLMIEMVVALEQRFDIKLPDDGVSELVTVGDLIAFLQRVRSAAAVTG
jgi:acyl carrier protein